MTFQKIQRLQKPKFPTDLISADEGLAFESRLVQDEIISRSVSGNVENDDDRSLGKQETRNPPADFSAANLQMSGAQSSRVCLNTCNSVIPKAYTSLSFVNKTVGPSRLHMESKDGE